MTSPLAIETNSLRKVYGDYAAVRGLTLQVPAGEVFGFLGPNGAGKTTSIKMLLGLVTPTSGEARLLGSPLNNPQVRAKIGFLPEHFRFHEWLTAVEFLRLHGELYGMPLRDLHERSLELLERVGLSAHRRSPLRTFSKGMLQRIGLAQALLNRPRLVFLDEPTSGLDPIGRRLVRDLIGEARSQGVTVFINSHILSEIEATCDRVAFIKNGEVLQVRSLKDMLAGETHLTLRLGIIPPENLVGLNQFGSLLNVEGGTVQMALSSADQIPQVVRWLAAQGLDVFEVHAQRPSLEDLFLQVIGTDGGL